MSIYVNGRDTSNLGSRGPGPIYINGVLQGGSEPAPPFWDEVPDWNPVVGDSVGRALPDAFASAIAVPGAVVLTESEIEADTKEDFDSAAENDGTPIVVTGYDVDGMPINDEDWYTNPDQSITQNGVRVRFNSGVELAHVNTNFSWDSFGAGAERWLVDGDHTNSRSFANRAGLLSSIDLASMIGGDSGIVKTDGFLRNLRMCSGSNLGVVTNNPWTRAAFYRCALLAGLPVNINPNGGETGYPLSDLFFFRCSFRADDGFGQANCLDVGRVSGGIGIDRIVLWDCDFDSDNASLLFRGCTNVAIVGCRFRSNVTPIQFSGSSGEMGNFYIYDNHFYCDSYPSWGNGPDYMEYYGNVHHSDSTTLAGLIASGSPGVGQTWDVGGGGWSTGDNVDNTFPASAVPPAYVDAPTGPGDPTTIARPVL